jgi:hypothetical protein
MSMTMYETGFLHVSATPNCPICADLEETIHHFLFVCPQYNREHFILSRKLGHKASSLLFINRPFGYGTFSVLCKQHWMTEEHIQ